MPAAISDGLRKMEKKEVYLIARDFYKSNGKVPDEVDLLAVYRAAIHYRPDGTLCDADVRQIADNRMNMRKVCP